VFKQSSAEGQALPLRMVVFFPFGNSRGHVAVFAYILRGIAGGCAVGFFWRACVESLYVAGDQKSARRLG
jgi:hypothetical protein